MGSSGRVLQNLELAQMQMHAQAQWAADALDMTLRAAAHWRSVADGFRSDCEEAMRARAAVERFREAAVVFQEIMDTCRRAELDADAILGTTPDAA